MPADVALSQCMGVGGCGWPSSSSMSLIIFASFAFKNIAPNSDSTGRVKVSHTPGLWQHITRPIAFSLVVDDFGVKYIHKDDADHLSKSLKNAYTLAKDWTGRLYCGITLKWNYNRRDRWLEISMPGYIKKKLSKYNHPTPKRPQHAPYPCTHNTYGKLAQDPIATDNSPPAGQSGITHVQIFV